MLEQTQIDARGVVVIKLPESAVFDQLLNLLYGTTKQKGVIHHDLQILTLGQLDEFFCLTRPAGERFLYENMFSVLKSHLGELVVCANRGDDGDRVDLRGPKKLIEVLRDFDFRIGLLHTLQ